MPDAAVCPRGERLILRLILLVVVNDRIIWMYKLTGPELNHNRSPNQTGNRLGNDNDTLSGLL